MAAKYFPALKWTRGEEAALRALSKSDKQLVLPLVELSRPQFARGESSVGRLETASILRCAESIAQAWGTDSELGVAWCRPLNEPSHAYDFRRFSQLIVALDNRGVRAVPVLSSRTSFADASSLVASARVLRLSRWILRYELPLDMPLPSETDVTEWFRDARALIGASCDQVSAVLDFGFVGEIDTRWAAEKVSRVFTALAKTGPWRHMVLLAGAFLLESVGPGGGVRRVPRLDWHLFREVSAAMGVHGLSPQFGDYGVSYVEPFEQGHLTSNYTDKLRYTDWRDWLVFEEAHARKQSATVPPELCRALTSSSEFFGPAFGAADKGLQELATSGEHLTPTPAELRGYETGHHISVVLRQITGAGCVGIQGAA